MRREAADNDTDSDHHNMRRDATEMDVVLPRGAEKTPRLMHAAPICHETDLLSTNRYEILGVN